MIHLLGKIRIGLLQVAQLPIDALTVGGGHGFLSPTDLYALRRSWMNRQKPEIVQVYRNILGANFSVGSNI